MSIEIERRFIVKGDKWKSFVTKSINFKQGYLSTNFDEWITRIRIIDDTKSEITLKSRETSIRNIEFSYPIPFKDSLSIWKKISKKIIKNRYILSYGPGEWIVDCFIDKNHPLVIAEVELNSENEYVEIPNWCEKEITGIKQFSNAYLASNPICN